MKSARSLMLAAVVTASVAGSAASAAAQPITSGPPHVEVGVTAVGIGGLFDLSDFKGDLQGGSVGAGPFVVFNPSKAIGVEFSGEILRLDRVQVQFYELSFLIRRHLPDAPRSFTFWRFGAGGHHEFERVSEYRSTNEDLSVTVYPAYDRHKVTAPNFVIVGRGIQRAVSEHVAIRAELDALVGQGGIGARGCAGIVIRVGSGDRSR
jgi:hypothetical protein